MKTANSLLPSWTTCFPFWIRRKSVESAQKRQASELSSIYRLAKRQLHERYRHCIEQDFWRIHAAHRQRSREDRPPARIEHGHAASIRHAMEFAQSKRDLAASAQPRALLQRSLSKNRRRPGRYLRIRRAIRRDLGSPDKPARYLRTVQP